MEIELVIDWEISPELVGMYSRSTGCEFVGNKDGTVSCFATAADSLARYARTKRYGNNERLGIMKILADGKLVGFSFPRVIHSKEYQVFKLEGTVKEWYRVGTVFIDHPHRGKGIMGVVISKFAKQFPNLLWACNVRNISSAKTAEKAGLLLSHDIYVRDNNKWSFSPDGDEIRVDRVFKTEVCV